MTEPLGELDELDPREQAFYAALRREATGATAAEPTAADLALVDAVLARHHATIGATTDLHDPAIVDLRARRGSRLRWAVAGLAVAAAVVLAFVAVPRDLELLRGSEGTWIAQEGQRRLGVGDALPLAVWLVAENNACSELDGSTLCAREGAVIRLSRAQDREVEVEVRRGELELEGALEVHTPAGVLRGESASTYAVRVSGESGTVEIEVEHGTIELVKRSGTRSLEPGDRVRLEAADDSDAEVVVLASEAEPEPAVEPAEPPSAENDRARPSRPRTSPKPTVAPTPGELLQQARARLSKGDDDGAAKAYAALIEAHPGSAEAQSARVSLGQLRLAAGRAKAAASLFSRYLERGGPLAQEALWGKVQAAAALGRREALAAAVDELVRRFPGSVYRTRAEQLRDR